ncbi:MAG: hypothetical protein ACFFB0_15995 [Promethearchaeota archaeon]
MNVIEANQSEFLFKVVIDGLIISNIIGDSIFLDSRSKTTGAEFYLKKFKLFNHNIKVQAWVLSQNKDFKSLKPSYYSNANIIIFIRKLNSCNNIEFINSVKSAKISLDRVFILETEKDFSDTFYEFTIIKALYEEGLMSELEYKEQEIIYKETKNLEFSLARDSIVYKDYQIENLQDLVKSKDKEILQLGKTIEKKDEEINILEESLKSKDKEIRSKINQIKIMENTISLKEKQLDNLRKELKLRESN